MRHASASTDTSFMQLLAPAPQGSIFAGSCFGIMSRDTAVASIHHPDGGLQKFSTGAIKQFSDCRGIDTGNGSFHCSPGNTPNGGFLAVEWNQGITEGGSNGSGLFYSVGRKRYLVGQLYGGKSSCRAQRAPDYYGRFDLAFDRGIKNWLLPSAAAPTTQ